MESSGLLTGDTREMKGGLEQGAGEWGFVAECVGDHSVVSAPQRMSRAGNRMSPLWHMVRIKHPGPGLAT